MENIINLLKDKNYHLEQFFHLNESELINFADGNFDGLETFYQSRETILDLIRCIDRLIEAAASTVHDDQKPSEQEKSQMRQCINNKNDLVEKILEQDLQILSVIEKAKSDMIKELRQVQAAKKAVGAYHSGDVTNKLDEKA